MCEVLGSLRLCPVFVPKLGVAAWWLSAPLFAIALVTHLHVVGAAMTPAFLQLQPPQPQGHVLACYLTQTCGSEVFRLEKDGLDKGRKTVKSRDSQPWLHFRIPCGQLMSTGAASQRVCHLWCCGDGCQQEQLVSLSLWPLLTLFNTNVLLKILFQVNSKKKINTGFLLRFCLRS